MNYDIKYWLNDSLVLTRDPDDSVTGEIAPPDCPTVTYSQRRLGNTVLQPM